MKFILKYFCVAGVTLYCGLIGFIGAIIVCSFLADAISRRLLISHPELFLDIATWGGGALLGGLPLGYISANWVGAKVGWSK
jgi:hypothetical protein